MPYVEVMIEHEVLSLNRPFTYFCEFETERGCRIRVPFNHRTLTGLVVKVLDEKPQTEYEILQAAEAVDEKPLLNEELFSLAFRISKWSASSLMSVFKTMLPSAYKPSSKAKGEVFETWLKKLPYPDSDPSKLKLTKKQKELYELLPYEVIQSEARKTWSPAILKTLETKGLIEREERIKGYRLVGKQKKQEPPVLSESQKRALFAIEHGDLRPFLLHGVTGSGKTEVFFRLAEKALAQKKSVLILVPEISLTPMMIERVAARFDVPILVFHSRLSNAEMASEYQKAIAMDYGIVIGTRKAVFTPFKELGLIIMDEEHDSSYKQDNTPKYHTRDAAIERARYFQCPIVLASATPSLDSYARAQKGVYQLVEMQRRISNTVCPIHLIDMKSERSIGGVSVPLIQQIQKRLEKGEKTILLLNRRGFIPVMKCASCQEVLLCEDCGIPLSYHKKENALVCHVCGRQYPVPSNCPSCGRTNWSVVGLGTERLEENVRDLFPKAKIVRMDADSTRFKNAHHKLLYEFEEEGDILIGTQMVAKGLDFEKVTLVGILQADAALQRADYRAAESTYQMLEQASGRAGRGAYEGEVLIQTYNPDHYVMQSIVHHNYQAFYKREMHYRHLGSYPPYIYMASLVFIHEDSGRAFAMAQDWVNHLKQEGVLVYGPLELSMRVKKSRIRILIKDKNLEHLQQLCWQIARKHHEKNRQVKLEVNINPMILEE